MCQLYVRMPAIRPGFSMYSIEKSLQIIFTQSLKRHNVSNAGVTLLVAATT